MAIAWVSSSTAGNASGGNLTVTTPSGAASGNILVVTLYREAGTWTLPAGWTQSGSDQRDTGSDNLYLSTAYLVLTSSPAANYTFTLSTTTWRIAAMDCFSGSFATDPTDVTATGGNGTSTSTPVAVSITTTATDTMVIAAHGNFNGSDVTVGSSGYTAGAGLGGTEQWYKATAASGATGDKSFSFSPSTAGSDWATLHFAFKESAAATLEQEGFRFGVDDGSESAHGWEAAQDTNITTADNTTKLLRILTNATNDPASMAPTLRYQKNGTGGYTAVPVGATTVTSPPTAPTATVTTVGTAGSPWTINRSTASSGDLVVFVIAWDDSTNVTSVTAPSGVNSETAVSIAGPVASASTEMRMQAWYYIATGAWSSGTLSFTPAASETCRAVSFTIPSGEYKSSDPIGWSNTAASAGTAETTLSSPTGTTESDDGDGRIYIAYGSDVDAITVPGSNWNTINNATGGGVGLAVGTRNTLASNSESVTALTATIASDSWASLAFVVKANVVSNDVYVSTSANITAGGEDTTARLTAPAAKSTSDFVTGRRWDDENGTDTTDITVDDYSEFEWSLKVRSGLSNGDYFEFRVYAGSSAFDTYTLTPKWTVSTGKAPPPFRRITHVIRR